MSRRYRKLDPHIKEDFLQRIASVLDVARAEALRLFDLLARCMEHRDAVSIHGAVGDLC